eukprot:CAMPEP_0175144152 /NCGR_PEP_ID=MMETSP0087-20121206/13942_1 /TAXON_ID=136419 /ORGANISM="Unknown Unknown, Strain D1" /LENGTH=857 /DNA_ID=CAMNT_0016428527 /DNA_START=47 /DNA_END=2620 /DNA_ORIENTATION=-
MSGLWRSQPMRYCSIMMRSECAHDTLKEVGEHGFFHPVDLGDPLDLAESAKVAKKRIDECRTWQSKLEKFTSLMEEFNVPVPDSQFTEDSGGDQELLGSGDLLEALTRHVNPREEELVRNIQFLRETKQSVIASIEHQAVLKVVAELQLEEGEEKSDQQSSYPRSKQSSTSTPLLGADFGAQASEIELGPRYHSYVCGVINTSAQPMFARLLFRISRGNAIAGFKTIEGGIVDGSDGENPVPKSVFYIMLTGQQLKDRIKRLCTNFEATVYETPNGAAAFESMRVQLENTAADQRAVLQTTEFAVVQLLQSFAGTESRSPLHTFLLALRKEKAICQTLMMCRFTYGMIYIEGWCPKIEVNNLRDRLNQAFRNIEPAPLFTESPQTPTQNPGSPPTYFRTNKFTEVYQGLVDTYGMARYREVNPGLFTIVTFPFLFAVMYGDFGHGIFLFSFASFLIYKEDHFLEQKRKGKMNEIFVMVFGGRYMLILMGFFAIYVGTIYNDCMSLPIHFFDSMWQLGNVTNAKNQTYVDYVRQEDAVYPWGVDWQWYHKKNELFFFNSLKMKLSIILGVSQMMFGLFLSAANHVHFKDRIALYFECIPQILFLSCTFGYLALMIIMKWCIRYENPFESPQLLTQMISMFLSSGGLPDQTDASGKQRPIPLYGSQHSVQTFLYLVAIATIPVMFVAKPCLKHREAKQMHRRGHANFDANDMTVEMNSSGDEQGSFDSAQEHGSDHKEHTLGDAMIHQAIHTIEFILGAISNTASYLRLWALSLAHAQLAKVFWEKMMMEYGIENMSGIGGLIGFGAWFGATFAVLLCMDVLECFLHALRLHWVEFQSKFYNADGYPFAPFNFKKLSED